MTKKNINTICMDCGKKRDKKGKISFGSWKDTCDIYGETDTWCASAQHDFGIYNNEEERQEDRIQDRI